MKNYRALQIRLKSYREAGFAVPALTTKYASLLRSYQRIQAILTGQACELPAFTEVVPMSEELEGLRHAIPNPRQRRSRRSMYQWLLMIVSMPIGVALFVVLFPVVWIQELHKPEQSC